MYGRCIQTDRQTNLYKGKDGQRDKNQHRHRFLQCYKWFNYNLTMLKTGHYPPPSPPFINSFTHRSTVGQQTCNNNHPLPHTLSLSPPFLSLSLSLSSSLSHTLSLTLSLTHSLSHTLSLFFSLPFSLYLSLSLTLTCSLSQ